MERIDRRDESQFGKARRSSFESSSNARGLGEELRDLVNKLPEPDGPSGPVAVAKRNRIHAVMHIAGPVITAVAVAVGGGLWHNSQKESNVSVNSPAIVMPVTPSSAGGTPLPDGIVRTPTKAPAATKTSMTDSSVLLEGLRDIGKDVEGVDLDKWYGSSCPVSACPPGTLRTMKQDEATMMVSLKATEDALGKGDWTAAGESYATFNRMVRTRIFFDGEYPEIFDKNENGVSDAWEKVSSDLNAVKLP